MKKLVGKQVTIFSLNYIYTGKLLEVKKKSVVLEDAKIVYETGKFSEKGFKDAQSLCAKEYNISLGCIESFGVLENKNG